MLSRLSAGGAEWKASRRFPSFLWLYFGDKTTPSLSSSRIWDSVSSTIQSVFEEDHSCVQNVPCAVQSLLDPKPTDRTLLLPNIEVHHSGSPSSVSLRGEFSFPPLNRRGWSVARVGVSKRGSKVGHALLTAVHSNRLFLFDPNGTEVHSQSCSSREQGSSTDPSIVASAFGVAASLLGFEAGEGEWLLPFQGAGQGAALRFLESEGLCAAYVSMVECILVANPSTTPSSLREVFSFRLSQFAEGGKEGVRRAVEGIASLPPPLLSSLSLEGKPLFPLEKEARDACVTRRGEERGEEDKRGLDSLRKEYETEAASFRSKRFTTKREAESALASLERKRKSLNDTVDRINRGVEKRNRFAEVAVASPLSAYKECPGMAEVFKGDRVEKVVAELLSHVEGRGEKGKQARQEMLKRGVLLNWVESQLFLFVHYSASLCYKTNLSSNFPPRLEVKGMGKKETLFREGGMFRGKSLFLVSILSPDKKSRRWVLSSQPSLSSHSLLPYKSLFSDSFDFPPWIAKKEWRPSQASVMAMWN